MARQLGGGIYNEYGLLQESPSYASILIYAWSTHLLALHIVMIGILPLINIHASLHHCQDLDFRWLFLSSSARWLPLLSGNRWLVGNAPSL